MFFNNICLAIDTINHSKFVNETMILEPLTTDACIFLKKACYSLYNKDLFSTISREGNDAPKFNAIGLNLKKSALICIEDDINPDFTAKLKKAAACFLNNVALNWENIDWKNPLSTITIFNKRADSIASAQHFLQKIATHYSNAQYFNIETCDHAHFFGGSCLTGKPDKLHEFIGFLKKEAIQAHTSPGIHLLMCAKNDQAWIERHQLLKEIFETIIKLHSILISPCPVGETMIA